MNDKIPDLPNAETIAELVGQGYEYCRGNMEIFAKYCPGINWQWIFAAHQEYLLKPLTEEMMQEFISNIKSTYKFYADRAAYNRQGEQAIVRFSICKKLHDHVKEEAGEQKNDEQFVKRLEATEKMLQDATLEIFRIHSEKPVLPEFMETVYEVLHPDLLEKEDDSDTRIQNITKWYKGIQLARKYALEDKKKNETVTEH